MNKDPNSEDDDLHIGEPISKDDEDEIELPPEGELTNYTKKNSRQQNQNVKDNSKMVDENLRNRKLIQELLKKDQQKNYILIALTAITFFLFLWTATLSSHINDLDQKMNIEMGFRNGLNILRNDQNSTLPTTMVSSEMLHLKGYDIIIINNSTKIQSSKKPNVSGINYSNLSNRNLSVQNKTRTDATNSPKTSLSLPRLIQVKIIHSSNESRNL